MKTFGARLKKARQLVKPKMSQGRLAELCDWQSQGRIGNYENNTRKPDPNDIQRISAVLAKHGVVATPGWLLFGEGPGPDDQDTKTALMIDLMKQLTEEQKAQLIKIGYTFIEREKKVNG